MGAMGKYMTHSSLFIFSFKGDVEQMRWIKRAAGIGMGIVVFAVAVHMLNYMYVNDDEWEYILWHSFYEDEGKIDNLYLGSSHVYCDIDPNQLDRLNGQYNFNLSSPVQLMNGTYYLLREADRRNELSHVYLELYYWPSTKDNFNDGKDPIETEVERNWENTDYMRFSANKLEYMTTMAPKEKYPEIFFGFVRYREHLDDWAYVRATIERKRSSEHLNFQYRYDYEDGNGYVEYLPRGRDYETREYPDTARIHKQGRILDKKPMGEASEAYLRKVISYCLEREIPITLFISPIYELQLISTENYDNYLNQVRGIAAEYELDIYDFNLAKEEYLPIQQTKYFRDVGHLNAAGGELFTDFFYKTVSGDAAENQKYFYDTYEEKLAHAEPEVYGIYYTEEPGEVDDAVNRRMVIASNREKGMEYKIVTALASEEGEEQYLLQDFSENKVFLIDSNEHGICTITYRMRETPGEEKTIEIAY